MSICICILAFVPNPLRAQVSPGSLSKAHASLNGPLQCVSCHKLGTGSESFKCLDCHTDIASRLNAHQGFHFAVVNRQAGDKDCVRCHSEHNGENFPIVHWEPSERAFDHSKTGYLLEGKHAGLACQQCHNATHIPAASRGSIKVKDLNRTFLGLSRDCLTCHEDKHRGQLGKDCTRCHSSFNDWKDVTGFDHSKTRYPLTGLHARVTCQRCHKPAGDPPVVQYTGVKFGTCADCHTDAHRGVFKAACESCHNTGGWKQISQAAVSSNFDHSKTHYPLLGMHVNVKCEACHTSGNLNLSVAFERCTDCHHTDVHHGQFRNRKDDGECSACHTVEGFKSSTFTWREHQATAYPLEGKHATVECGKCHIPAGADTLFKITRTECEDCHKDIHGRQFAAAPLRGRCVECHTVHGFKPSTYTLARHNQTRFVLTGGHLAVPCDQCHQEKRLPGSQEPVPYHFPNLNCTTCHTDPHKGQFAERMNRLRDNGTLWGCEACHSTRGWKELVGFDHAATRFPLLGAHRSVNCISCHKPPSLEVTMRNVEFATAPTRCQGCHEDPHARQFAKAGANPTCEQCHNATRWRPALFDHETQTSFSLKGGHQGVPCRDCHKTYRQVEGKQVLFYAPTPKQCAACHGPSKT